MQTTSWHLLMMFFVAAPLLAQENAEEKVLFVKAGELAYSNPDEILKWQGFFVDMIKIF